MLILIDTNILLRSIDSGHQQYPQARDSLISLDKTDQLIVVPQILYEFWVVCSRSVASNGYGLTTDEIVRHIEGFLKIYKILYDNQTVSENWFKLATRYQVQGKPAHDCRLVAAMLAHNVPKILTFNCQDFRRYTEITAISPLDLSAPTAPSTDIQ